MHCSCVVLDPEKVLFSFTVSIWEKVSLTKGRTYLRMVLEELVEKGYVRKEKRGRQVYYSISSQYRAYFRQIGQGILLLFLDTNFKQNVNPNWFGAVNPTTQK